MSERPTPAATPSRRQAARLAAVQALYQWQEGEHAPAEIIEQFLNVRTGEAGEGGMRRDADRPLFKDVVEGTVAHKDELEQTVSAALAEDWTWKRIDRPFAPFDIGPLPGERCPLPWSPPRMVAGG